MVAAGQLGDGDRDKMVEHCQSFIAKHHVIVKKRFDDAYGDLIIDGKVAYVIRENAGGEKDLTMTKLLTLFGARPYHDFKKK